MGLCLFFFAVVLFLSAFHCTDQKIINPLSSVFQTNSTSPDDECLERVLLQSRDEHVHLVCGSNATYCPSTIVSKIRVMSWMFFDDDVPVGPLDRRDFCIIAADNVTHVCKLLVSNLFCQKEKIVFVFPSASSSNILALEKVFSVAWEAGIIDVVIVLAGAVCHVYNYIPIHEHSGPHCPDLTPVLITSWTRNSTVVPTKDNKVNYFTGKKISNLYLCVVQVLEKSDVQLAWSPIVEFLQVAMNATFNITLTPWHPDYHHLRPSEFQITPVLAHESMAPKCILPAYLFYEENLFAVPRVPAKSSEWSRLFNELSAYVWYALVVTLLMTVGVFYVLIQGSRNLVYVFLFLLQPLLVSPQSGNFLSWRGRIFFVNWLMFCFILQSSYLCTFLSELTVPSTADALNSLDDLLESVLPIHTALHVDAVNLPFQLAQSEALMRKIHIRAFDGDILRMIQHDRHDMAYIVPRYYFSELFLNMPYRVLPGASINVVSAPFRLNRPSPYGRFFEIAFMRVMGAGGVDKVWRNKRLREFLTVGIRRGGGGSDRDVDLSPQPLRLKSFGSLLVAWCLGCIIAFASFVFEVCLHCKIEIISKSVPSVTGRITYVRYLR